MYAICYVFIIYVKYPPVGIEVAVDKLGVLKYPGLAVP